MLFSFLEIHNSKIHKPLPYVQHRPSYDVKTLAMIASGGSNPMVVQFVSGDKL